MKFTIKDAAPGFIIDLPPKDGNGYAALNPALAPPSNVDFSIYNDEGRIGGAMYNRTDDGRWVSDDPDADPQELVPGTLEYKTCEALYKVKNTHELRESLYGQGSLEIEVE